MPPEQQSANAVVVRDLVYHYGDFVAVEGVSFSIQRGEIFALLGTNGAGKTTTLESLEGFRRPTSGQVNVLGYVPFEHRFEIKARTGMMLQESGLIDEMTVLQMLELWQRLSPRSDDVERLLDLVQLEARKNVAVSSLSGGEKRRLDFAMSIWGSPPMVILDEPTTGLDPQSREQLWEVVKRIRDEDTTILLTTHYLEEAEALADRVAIMDSGRVAIEGTLSEVLASVPARISAVTSTLPQSTCNEIENLTQGTLTVTHHYEQTYLTFETRQLQNDLTHMMNWASKHGIVLNDLRASPASLTEVFMSIPDQGKDTFVNSADVTAGARK